MATAQQTVRQAERVRQALAEVGDTMPRRVARMREQFDQFLPRVRQVIHHARVRVLEGQTVPADAKIVSLFEPHTRVIPRFKGGAAVEFGRTVVVDEVEGGHRQPVSCAGGRCDRTRRAGASTAAPSGRVRSSAAPGDRGPWVAGLHSPDNERLARAAGVRYLVIPSGGKVSPQQRAREKDRTGRRHYRWRAGSEGRIHSLRRDDGLKRCADHGADGLERGVGWGVLASNLRHSGQEIVVRERRAHQRAA